ncbi:MAG TPA: MBL fold metallo-hydrolase RNA specificity domain-containing protein [Candidatus Dormibacteraeota bacterium]
MTWDRGISLVGHDLWFDPQTIREVAFVSHAHSDHARRHHHALLTSETLELSPGPRKPRGVRLVGLGETVPLGEARVTLYDAGHMLGSAQVLFEHRGVRLLYTGDIKLRRGWGRPDTEVPAADVLVLESTYGKPHFRFPDPDSVVEALAIFCRRALDAGVIPVLLAHALGKAQEVMLALGPYGFEFALEERCVEPARAYERAGARLPPWTELDPDLPARRVVVAPPTGKDAIRRLPRHRTALVSGWAQDPGFWRIFGADFAFPFSDHCDFDELLAVIERSGAEKVYTVHGFTEELARQLRKRGVRAHALAASEQLALAL